MKNLLLLLSALIVAPAWAADSSIMSTPEAKTSVTIGLKGSAKGVRTLLAELGKDAVYKDAGCSAKPMKKSAKTVKISCSNASGALLDYLSKNTPDKVRWSISGAATPKMSTDSICPVGCTQTTCGGVGGCFKRGCVAC